MAADSTLKWRIASGPGVIGFWLRPRMSTSHSPVQGLGDQLTSFVAAAAAEPTVIVLTINPLLKLR